MLATGVWGARVDGALETIVAWGGRPGTSFLVKGPEAQVHRAEVPVVTIPVCFAFKFLAGRVALTNEGARTESGDGSADSVPAMRLVRRINSWANQRLRDACASFAVAEFPRA